MLPELAPTQRHHRSLQSERTITSGRHSSSRHLCKVAFAREYSRDPHPHDQAGLPAELVTGDAQERVLQHQQHIQVGTKHSPLASWRNASSSSSGGGGSSSARKWPWSIWSQTTSSSPTVVSNSSSGTVRYSRSSSSSRSYSLLEQSAAAVSEQHARRGLMPTGHVTRRAARSGWLARFRSDAAAAAAAAGDTPDRTAAVAAGSIAVVSNDSYLESFTASSSNSSSTSSTWEESAAALRIIEESWDEDSSSGGGGGGNDKSQLFLYDLMPPAAAAAVAAEAPPSSSSRLALLLGDTYPMALAGASSSSSTAGSGATGSPLSSQEILSPKTQQRQQWGLNLEPAGTSHTVPLPNVTTLRRSLQAVGPHGQPTSSSSSSRRQAGSSSSGGDDADWLTAVLSAPTNRLSSHSNAVLTNSLRRLASLRSATGVLTAAAVDGTEGLLDSIRSRFGTFQLQQFEEVALQLAQLGYQPDAEWLTAFERSSLAVMPGGSPRLLSRLLLSRSKLGGAVSSEWCAACCKHMADAPHKLSVSSWVNALYALVRLKHTPNRQFQMTFFSATAERLDDISPELLTHLVWSLSRLKLSPSFMWWRSLVTATASIEKPFSHAQLASLVHSVALWAEPCGIAAQDVQRFVDMLLVEIHEHLGLLQPAELTIVVWSLGSLVSARKLQPDHDLHDEILSAIQGQLPRLNPIQCSNLCWGLAKLNHRLTDSFAEALLLEVQAQLSGFTDSNLCSVLWALAKLGLVPLTPFRQQLWEELHQRVKNLGLQDLSTLLWALAQLQLQPPEDTLSELCDRSGPHIPACDVTHLTNVVWALGRLNARPDRAWVEAAEAASMQVLPSAGLTQIVNLAWGLSRLRHPVIPTDDSSHSPHSRESQSHTSGTIGYSFSPAWQAACLRELRLRCVCAGVDVDCGQLVHMLRELGVVGLAEGAAAVADSLFAEQEDDAYCSLQFQPGCR